MLTLVAWVVIGPGGSYRLVPVSRTSPRSCFFMRIGFPASAGVLVISAPKLSTGRRLFLSLYSLFRVFAEISFSAHEVTDRKRPRFYRKRPRARQKRPCFRQKRPCFRQSGVDLPQAKVTPLSTKPTPLSTVQWRSCTEKSDPAFDKAILFPANRPRFRQTDAALDKSDPASDWIESVLGPVRIRTAAENPPARHFWGYRPRVSCVWCRYW